MHDSLLDLDRKVSKRERGRLRDDPVKYQGQPVLYAEHYLGLNPGLWSVQKEIADAIHKPPYMVMVPASHSVGKTHVCAVLTSYWFDCYPTSSAVITTAPTSRDVKDLLWTQVRQIRGVAGLRGFAGPRVPELWENETHFAKGFTAEYGESFQGRHLEHMLFIFDEAIGIDATFWNTTRSMFQPDGRHAWVAIGNPTDQSSQMYAESQSGAWNVIEMGALGFNEDGSRNPARDHPNITRGLAGLPPLYPSAVTLPQFEAWIAAWTTETDPSGAGLDDVLEWPPRVPCGCVKADGRG